VNILQKLTLIAVLALVAVASFVALSKGVSPLGFSTGR
jgi:hypothetical protein